jgi:hypothetical protein
MRQPRHDRLTGFYPLSPPTTNVRSLLLGCDGSFF